MTSVADQCQFDHKCFGPGPAKRPTQFMTNSVELAKELCRQCDTDQGIRALVPVGIWRQLDKERVEDKALCEMIVEDCTRFWEHSKGDW